MRDWQPHLTQLRPERRAGHVATGAWADRRLADHLDDAVAAVPDRTAVVDRRGRRTYREIGAEVDAVAAGLLARGVEPGDVVTIQLPNWAEVLVLVWACSRIGAVFNTIPPIFRQRDVGIMLELARPKVVVVPDVFRGFAHAEMLADLRRRVPGIATGLVVGDAVPPGLERWSDFVAGAPALGATSPAHPDAVAQVAFTSGTTGEPKGILHTHNTLLAPARAFIQELGLTSADTVHMASTLGHQTGILYGVCMPVMLAGTVVLQELWDAARFVELIESERITMTNGAAPFLSDLLRAPNLAEHDVSSLRLFGCFGTALPRPLVLEARERLPHCRVFGGWGMTETGLPVINGAADTLDQICNTDGVPIAGTEIRILDDMLSSEVPPDTEGELVTRGPLRHLGFVQPELSERYFLEDDWYVTGDRGRIDATGRFTMSARSKDIVIRGGENVPVVEVESLLLEHPAVAAVAVVAAPDPRLGEKACACVITEPGATFAFEDMTDWLEAKQLTRQFWPELLELFDEFPTTPSGKTQKYQLRAIVLERLGARDAATP